MSVLEKNKEDLLYIVGKIEELEALKNYSQVTLIDAREVLEMTENILAIRRKKESSMVKTIMLAKKGEVDAVLSCGNTGAYYASAMLFFKRLEGVEKSCLMATLPTYNDKGVLMLDVGANSENTPEQLKSFAIMGNIYAKNIRGIQEPKVALLNIGTESKKGDEAHQQAYQLLQASDRLHFVGNVEGRDILSGDYDVVVTDGFSGNIALKTCEGVASTLMKMIKESMMSSLKGKIGALLAKSSLYSLKEKFDYKSVGGALMMGFEKAVVKAHGASDAKAFCSAMDLAYQMVKMDVVSQMKEGLSQK